MAHVAEEPKRYVCERCQVVHAGTPIHESGGDHSFEPPGSCGGCDSSSFVEFGDWVHHHA
ncbi:hypothetical protein C475_20038 [Halosimplex carlsbadense 2-9-1]|uniref:Small CPxCG-related zinc finger protein n=1 Tax=Halosimplex carlsbadense 2-9-1 TaxID=797114 RepID=M0CFE0_9EURY|nr:hypothetical protein [Halosimplex carlsbadense]ELZ20589.1 hypothetical protein C475_20038 [Halosimplex carlsbadense 2-9-1]